MQKLAKREEEIMQVLWNLERAFAKEIIAALPDDPKPHYNTIATILKILREKGFVDHKKFGNTFQFFPLVTKEEYQQREVKTVLKNYFDNSYSKMVTYFAKEEKISESELKEILQMIKKK